MITIIHGDSYVNSRKKLNELISEAKQDPQLELIRLDLKETSLEALTQALSSASLFNDKQFFVLENLLSLPRSKQKESFVDIVANNQEKNIILWDKKAITVTSRKKLSKAKVIEFKAPVVIFKFLDNLNPKTNKIALNFLHQALNQDAPELIFFLLTKRIFSLIQALDDPNSLKGAPWQIGKLKQQVKNFTLEQLISLHDQLLNIDYQIKTGQTPHSLTVHLDLLLLSL